MDQAVAHGHGQEAPEMPKKEYTDEPCVVSGMGIPHQPIGIQSMDAPPPYSTVIIQGGTQQCIYPPGTQIVYRTPQPLTAPPEDHLIYAILVTVFCFWPTGIIAIIKALEVQKSAQMGDALAAETASRSALQMSRISLGIGAIVYVMLAIILVIEFVLIFSLQ